jgi:hypothetical protein
MKGLMSFSASLYGATGFLKKSLRHRFSLSLLFALALSSASTPSVLLGQFVSASLRGTVQDTSGSAVPGAKVEALNTSIGVAVRTVSDAAGRFVFASLAPGGPYKLSVEAGGFKTEQQSGINLAVNQVIDVSISLQVGTAEQRVEVNADAGLVETDTAAMGQVIGNRSIDNLPLNQRNVYSLMFLVPGVTGSVTYQYNSLNFSVNGGRPGTTNVLVDGIPASPPLIVPIGGFAVFPSVDAVQEFKVQTSAYSAEFGRSGSGIVNVILKSGTNKFHGSIYDFVRNSALDANTYFASHNGTPLPSFSRNQFGGSFSGPVWIPKVYNRKDTTFFLFSYEGLRQGAQSEVTTTVPTALQRMGDFSQTFNAAGAQVVIYDPTTTTPSGSDYVRQPFAQNKITTIDPVAAKILSYYPLPNQPGAPFTGTNNYFASGTSQLNIDTIDSRVDEVFNGRNRLFVSYSRRNVSSPPALLFPAASQIAEGGSSQPQISNSAAIDYTRTISLTFIVDIPLGFSRTFINFVPISGHEPVRRAKL